MRRYRIIAVSISLAIILCLGGISLASGWVTHATSSTEHWSWSNNKFRSLQVTYYQNNTTAYVDLLKSGHWIWVTGNWPIIGGQAITYHGNGTWSTHTDAFFIPAIYSGEMATQWWNHGGARHYKYGQGVVSMTHAGPWGPASVLAGWNVIFWPNGTFSDDPVE